MITRYGVRGDVSLEKRDQVLGGYLGTSVGLAKSSYSLPTYRQLWTPKTIETSH